MKKSRNNWLVAILVLVLIAALIVPTVSGSMDSVSTVAGRDGKDGKDGKDGQDGLTPIFRVNSETNEWECSYSGGLSWISLGVQASEKFDENNKLNPEYIDQAWYANYGKEGGGTTVIISEQTVTGGMWQYRQMDIQPGINYDVYINGEKYTCMAFNDDGGICLGNKANMSGDYPFCIFWAGGAATAGMFLKNSTLSYPLTLKVTDAYVNTYNKLPEQYLPDNLLTEEDLPALGGGTTLDVTAQPGQTITVKEVDANGKPISWEAADVQERTHWSEATVGDILSKTTISPYMNDQFGCVMYPVTPFELELGKSYTVIFDDYEFVCTAESFSVPDHNIEGLFLGNPVFFGGVNNGMPFCAAFFTSFKSITNGGETDILSTGEYFMVFSMDTEQHTVQIVGEKTEYHKIPDEFINGDFLIMFSRSMVDDSLIMVTPWEEIIEAIYDHRNIRGIFYEETYSFDQYGEYHKEYEYRSFTFTNANVGREGNYVCKLSFLGLLPGSTLYGFIVYRDADGTVTISPGFE